ncbi:Uma2 family endonuclease [Synechocystis sp. CS-94]|nr:Uma2 family endonuclease [Synechocystis sp. CS-94]
MGFLTIKLDPLNLSDEQFYQLCQNNRDLRFERNSQGDLLIMSPTGGETGNRNLEIAYQLQAWNRAKKLGVAFDSSTGFKLPNGANKSPDVSWIPMAKWNGLTHGQQQGFLPLCPDFLIELRSRDDSLKILQEKMQEYRENGTRLGWLINRQDQEVEIYRQNQQVEVLHGPMQLSGEDVLADFILDLMPVW